MVDAKGAFVAPRSAVHFCIEQWSHWAPSQPGVKAEIPEVDGLLRRRASATDRAALRAAFDAVPDRAPIPAVFCSRHGEVHRSVELLEQLARGEGLSPTSFSLSVHSTAAALFSLSRGDRSPMSAIAAGADSLPQGVLEAVLRLEDGDERVLVVAHDDLLPEPFRGDADEPGAVFGLAMVLRRTGGPAFSLAFDAVSGDADGAPGDPAPQPPRVAAFLASDALELTVQSPPRRWTWRRHA